MKKYEVIDKKVGQTPLQALEAFRKTKPELCALPLTYAGRLDPMAGGKLLILIGDECKRRNQYDGLDKEYRFEILFGLKSDTGDVLGLAESFENGRNFSEKEIRNVTKSLIGKHSLPYPAFSSKTVLGKPLFHRAIENNLDEVEIPMTDVRVYKMCSCGSRVISREELVDEITAKINLLQTGPLDSRTGSGFRKEEILRRWKELRSTEPKQYVISEFKTIVSSGTYIRTLAPLIAERLGTGGLAYSIQRLKIGRYCSIGRCMGFWRRTF